MSQDNKPNLAGWAALITAIAALITAIGFPNFFPDLVKTYLPQDKDNFLTNSSKTQEGDLQSISKCSGLQKLEARLAKTVVFGSHYLQIKLALDSQ